MKQALLERVLSCPTLPSLPGVAVRLLEQTRDPDVSLTTIAQTVQADPALAARVLKTVNSSYYGLALPCPTITRAMTLLGLNAVKAIVLGFSLVDSTKTAGVGESFDMSGYWRRCVYTGAGARAVALRTRCWDPEEAFIAALLQDIGVLACLAAILPQYRAVLEEVGEEHDRAGAVERRLLGFDHQQVGQRLGEKWRLPPQIIECIATHHAPAAADRAHEGLVKCVHLGGVAAEALCGGNGLQKFAEFTAKAHEWFKLDMEAGRSLLEQTASGGRDLGRLLELRTGVVPDVGALLTQAHEQLAVVNEAVQIEAVQLRRNNDELARQTMIDGLTGVFNRAHFDRMLRVSFERCKTGGLPLGIVFIDADRFKLVNDAHGHQVGDAVLMELAERLKGVTPESGVLCRYGGEEFAIILAGHTLEETARVAESCREACAARPFDLTKLEPDLVLPVTISAGVSAMDATNMGVTKPEQVTHAADQGLYTSKKAGRNRVTVNSLSGDPVKQAAAPAAASMIMIVEDDPLASRLLSFLFSKCRDLKTVAVRTGEEAMAWLESSSPACPRPDAVLADLHLPGMSGLELAKALRGRMGPGLPLFMVSSSMSTSEQKACMAAGADELIDKSDFCTNPDRWLSRVVELVHRNRVAA